MKSMGYLRNAAFLAIDPTQEIIIVQNQISHSHLMIDPSDDRKWKGLFRVRAKGREYLYAWRGGPRVRGPVGSPEFVDDWKAAQNSVREQRAQARIGAAHAMVESARKRACTRDIPFEVTVQWVADQLTSQGDRCLISGMPFQYVPSKAGTHRRNPRLPSLDRIDAPLGYTPSNIRIVLMAVNFAINEWGLDFYVDLCRRVAAASPHSKNRQGMIAAEESAPDAAAPSPALFAGGA